MPCPTSSRSPLSRAFSRRASSWARTIVTMCGWAMPSCWWTARLPPSPAPSRSRFPRGGSESSRDPIIPERRPLMLVQIMAVAAALALAAPVAAQTRLNVAIAADVNVVEVHKTLLGPGFKAMEPAVDLNVVGTGTGEPASRAIYTKIKAQADTGRKPWDLDVALVSMTV